MKQNSSSYRAVIAQAWPENNATSQNVTTDCKKCSRIRLHFWPFHFDSFLSFLPSFSRQSVPELFEFRLFSTRNGDRKKHQRLCSPSVFVCVEVWPNLAFVFSLCLFFSHNRFQKRASNAQPYAHWINSQNVSHPCISAAPQSNF